MQSTLAEKLGSIERPTLWFLSGLALALLALWFPFIPAWQTFIHMWRVEIAASIVLLGLLGYVMVRLKNADVSIALPREEWRLFVLPIIAMIAWSALSTIWAPSWRSAVHHSLIWTEYLVFYFMFRHMLDRGDLRLLLTVFVATLVLYALPAVLEYVAHLTYQGKTTLGMRYSKWGEQVVTLIPLVLLGVIRTRGRWFVGGAIVVTLMWLLIFCSFGRANNLLFAVSITTLFAALLISKRYRRYAPRFAMVGAVLLVAPLALQLFAPSSSAPAVPVLARTLDEGTSSSNDFRKLMVSLSVEMIRENPVLGIGADNFGMQVNKYRQSYGSANPGDRNLASAEDQIPGHAHNELLQIVAELGLVGAGIVLWFLAGIAVLGYRALRDVRSGSLYPFAAMLGIGAFFMSSLVSSYSFRVMQNGIVFFFVLAVASKLLFRREPSAARAEYETVNLSGTRLKLACAVAMVAALGLTFYSSLRVTSVAITARANATRSLDEASPLYMLAISLDEENPDARHNFGMRLFRRQRFAEAAVHLENAVALGRAPSAELSYLATAKTLSGDSDGAEATMKTAAAMYPRSPFVLTRYAALLETNGKSGAAKLPFDRALEIDARAATTWRTAIDSGPKVLSELAARDSSYMHIMELKPESSIYAVVSERYIKFPAERRFSGYRVLDDEE